MARSAARRTSASRARRRCSPSRPGRPVLLRLTRRESMWFHVKRHPMWLDYTAGCDEEGHLVAVRARIIGDNGAYASVGGKVLERAAGHACGPYRVPNVDVEATAVYTNNPPSGAMRGFGANQAAFAMEGVLDMLAEQVGHRRLGDPLAQRARRGRPVHDRPAAGRGRRRPGDAARRPGRLPGRAVRGHRVRHQERGRGQRAARSAAARSCAPRRTAPSRCSTPGPRWARAPTRCSASSRRPSWGSRRSASGSSWTRPTSWTPARRRRRGRRCWAGGPSSDACAALRGRPRRPGDRRARGPGGARVRGRVRRGLDHEARGRPWTSP